MVWGLHIGRGGGRMQADFECSLGSVFLALLPGQPEELRNRCSGPNAVDIYNSCGLAVLLPQL
jgi:hypothetical protein